MNSRVETSLEIRRTSNKYVFDLFYGNGWDNWSRVHKGRSSAWVVAGSPLGRDELNALMPVLDDNNYRFHRIPCKYGETVQEMFQWLENFNGN